MASQKSEQQFCVVFHPGQHMSRQIIFLCLFSECMCVFQCQFQSFSGAIANPFLDALLSTHPGCSTVYPPFCLHRWGISGLRCQCQFISPNNYYLTLPNTQCTFLSKTLLLSLNSYSLGRVFQLGSVDLLDKIILRWGDCHVYYRLCILEQTYNARYPREAKSLPFENPLVCREDIHMKRNFSFLSYLDREYLG